MADQLTDSEAKMLRELAMSERSTRAALTKLLLAAKEKLAVTIENGSYTDIPGCYRQLAASEIRNADLGDLFEEKV